MEVVLAVLTNFVIFFEIKERFLFQVDQLLELEFALCRMLSLIFAVDEGFCDGVRLSDESDAPRIALTILTATVRRLLLVPDLSSWLLHRSVNALI